MRTNKTNRLYRHLLQAEPAYDKSLQEYLFLDYFSGALSERLRIRGFPVYGLEKICPKRLMSFQDREGFSLALGVIRSASPDMLLISTPLRQKNKVASLRVGDLRLDLETGEKLL